MSIIAAIHSLRPNAEWTLDGDDVENMIWHTANIEPLTIKKVQDEIKRLKNNQALAQATVEAKRAAAVAKLEALGLDADDLKALGL